MSENIGTHFADGILRVEMKRPEKRNAITVAMYGAMADALLRADDDPAVRALLVHGAADCFTAGNDLKDFLANSPGGDDSPVFRFLHAISSMKTPLIASVAGVAVGVGTTMLLHCDLVFAGQSARFQLPFANLGLCPEAASSLLLPRLVGHQRAAELLLLGQTIDATRAYEIGLVNKVFPDSVLLDEAMNVARRLTQLPAASLRATKALMKRPLSAAVRETMAAENAEFRLCLGSPEAKEAFSAFLEKRQPDFGRFS